MAVPVDSHSEQGLPDVRQLSMQVRQELEKFFVATTELQAKILEFLGWRGPKRAIELIKRSRKTPDRERD